MENARRYSEQLAGVAQIVCPSVRADCTHIFHLYVIRSEARDALRDALKAKGIATGIHYPTALPFLEAYGYLGHVPEDFPVVHRCQNEILSLPMYPELSLEEIDYVCSEIRAFFAE